MRIMLSTRRIYDAVLKLASFSVLVVRLGWVMSMTFRRMHTVEVRVRMLWLTWVVARILLRRCRLVLATL